MVGLRWLWRNARDSWWTTLKQMAPWTMTSYYVPFSKLETLRIQIVTYLQQKSSLDDPSETPSHSSIGSLSTTTLTSAQFGKEAWASKEKALKARFSRSQEDLNIYTRALTPLSVGDKVFSSKISMGPHPNKWDRTGLVFEIGNFDQYRIKVDTS